MYHNIEMRHLRYFVAVAEELSFTKAAKRLNISQPPLSAQIKALEEDLGVALFVRDKRSVSLTQAGKYLLERSRLIVSQFEDTIKNANTFQFSDRERIALGLNPSVDLTLLPKIIHWVDEHFPDIDLCMKNMVQHEIFNALEEKVIDIGFLRLPISEFENRGLNVKSLYKENTVLAISTNHPFTKLDSVPVKKLDGEKLVIWHRHVAPYWYDLILNICRNEGFLPNFHWESDSIQTALGIVSSGCAVAIVPESAKKLNREGVTFKPLDPEDLIVLELGIAWRKKNDNKLLKEIVNFILSE